MIREPSVITYPLGFTYSHFRGGWLFALCGRLDNFKFGADWYINKWQLNDLYIYIGFFQLSWTRLWVRRGK